MEAGNSWGLSAPESYILLHGPKGGPEGAGEAFKLALVELAARGWIVTVEDEEGSGEEVPGAESLLARGDTDFAPKDRPLVAALAVFEGALSEAGDPEEGIPVYEVRRAAEERYDELSAFAGEEVLPSLEERGYYEYAEDRILGLIPRERWKETEAGARAKEELERTTDEARENFPEWARRDPDRALSFLGMAGPAMLLMPSLYPEVAGLSAGSGESGKDEEEGEGSGYGLGAAPMAGAPGAVGDGDESAPEPGSLDPEAFEGLPGLSDSLDSVLSGGFFGGMFGDPGGAGDGGGFGGDGGAGGAGGGGP